MTDDQDPIRQAARLLGALGGRAGRGSSKRRKTSLTPETARKLAASRSPESQRRAVDYRELSRKGVEARRAKRGGLPPVTS